MESQSKLSSGPELRGSNITLESITAPTDVSSRKTKIVCTLGPACWEVPQLEELIDAGLSVARFNFSHGDHEGHLACLNRLREAAKNKGVHVGKEIYVSEYLVKPKFVESVENIICSQTNFFYI